MNDEPLSEAAATAIEFLAARETQEGCMSEELSGVAQTIVEFFGSRDIALTAKQNNAINAFTKMCCNKDADAIHEAHREFALRTKLGPDVLKAIALESDEGPLGDGAIPEEYRTAFNDAAKAQAGGFVHSGPGSWIEVPFGMGGVASSSSTTLIDAALSYLRKK